MSKERELAELDQEFASSEAMSPATFAARREEIRNRAPQDEEARRADEATEQDEKFATVGMLKRVARNIAEIVKPISDKVANLEANIAAVDRYANATQKYIDPAIQGNIERALDPLGTRLSNVEFKVAALALNMTQRDPAQLKQIADSVDRYANASVVLKHVEIIEALQARLDESAATIESLERRLAQLESQRI